MVWHQVPIYCNDCNYCVTRDAAVPQGNGTPPRRVDVLIQRVKCMSRPACKCGPATRSYPSSCMLKHFHITNKIREVCRMESSVLWHCAKSWFRSSYLLSYKKSTTGVSFGCIKVAVDSRFFRVASINRRKHCSSHKTLTVLCGTL